MNVVTVTPWNGVVFVTTCKGRLQHVIRTLPQNLADNPEAKFVLLGYNDRDGLADYIRTNHSADIASGRLVFYEYRNDVPFRMAHAKNLSHRLGIIEGADILCNLDADNFTGPGFASYLSAEFSTASDCFKWARMIKHEMPRGISGRIAVRPKDFWLVGGYDEKYQTHSPDDKDFHARLARLGIEDSEIDRRFLSAVNHTDKMRYREYPEAADVGSADFLIHPHNTVVNAGRIGCGTVWRNFGAAPVIIKPVATRIFAIGLHKTATQSIHAAFELLGYKAWHWFSAHQAKAIWREMTSQGRSLMAEQFYALSDLPIPMLFREFDRAYPGSKFILTVRNEKDWLDSVRRHWEPEHNIFRSQWDTDAFSHRVHELLYGQQHFDAKVMLERYRRHNQEVAAYFESHPQDLLVMDMDQGHGWKELCGFLGAPEPRVPYPRRSATNPKL